MIQLPSLFAATCAGGDFFGFPKWYKYLDGAVDPSTKLCSPQLANINDIYLIVAAIIEMMLRVAALAAVGFVIYGGVQYVLSQGNTDKTTKARNTIFDAFVGLAISVTAAAIVAFVAGRIT